MKSKLTKEAIYTFVDDVRDYFGGFAGKPEALLSWDLNSRGGVLKIDASCLFDFKREPYGTECGTYQNYLGGGLLGAVCFGSNFSKDDLYKRDQNLYALFVEELKKLHHDLTNHDDDEWENQSYGQNQLMPVSAY
jgi:hypothetical protein